MGSEADPGAKVPPLLAPPPRPPSATWTSNSMSPDSEAGIPKQTSEFLFPSTLSDSANQDDLTEEEQTHTRSEAFVDSQLHLLKVTDYNPKPNMLPPPIAGLAGHHLRHRHVAVVIGLPLRGKGHVAARLERYLKFFHGAQVEKFDVTRFLGTNGDSDLLHALKDFFESHSTREPQHEQKAVDSGGFAIIYPSDTHQALPSMWSGHSKWQRRWMAQILERDLQAQLIFVEVHVNNTELHRQEYMQRLELSRGCPVGSMARKIEEYMWHYVTIQDDGSEDDLTYLKIINFSKVIANNMMVSYLGCRVCQFLASTHPYHRIVYFTRHGESEYNVQKKIGGDSALSARGREYSLRLAEFADLYICRGAAHVACVGVAPQDVEILQERLKQVPENGHCPAVLSTGDWSLLTCNKVEVREGMRLLRWQNGVGRPFENAPPLVETVIEAAKQRDVTLVFVEGTLLSYEGGPETARPCRARLWTSSLRRTNETAENIQHHRMSSPNGKVWVQMDKRVYRNLDEIYAGEFEGLTYEEVREREPKEASLRMLDKLGYRYPRGESYYDLITRLESPIQQLETLREPTLIVAHQAICRLLYAWLRGVPREEVTELPIPLHTVVKVEFDGTGAMEETRFVLGPIHRCDDGQKNL